MEEKKTINHTQQLHSLFYEWQEKSKRTFDWLKALAPRVYMP